MLSLALRVAAITMLLAGSTRLAGADNTDTLIDQLDSDSDKVRLAAALNLAKLGDTKAILPLVKTVNNDGDDKVRAAAAVALGKLVTANTSKSIKNLAIKALQKAMGDSSASVKKEATKALTTLGAGGGTSGNTNSTNTSGGGTSIYVNVGSMSSKTGNAGLDPKMRSAMVKAATSTLARVASSMATTWPGGVPTKQQLSAKGYQGFYVDGTVNEVKVSPSGSSATVSCKVSMLLASYPDKSVFGFLNGGAKVQGSSSQKDVGLASEDCVAAVVEDLIAKKIVPTITTKVGTP